MKKANKKQSNKSLFIREFILILVKISIVCVIFVSLFTFIIGFSVMDSDSMSPSIKDRDLILYYRLNNEYSQSDVVIVNVDNNLYPLRVVAGPGDIVNIENGVLIVNEAVQQEQNIFESTNRYEEGISFPVELGEDEYFVLGDNRDNCTDSRIFGAINKNNILGSVFTVIRRMSI